VLSDEDLQELQRELKEQIEELSADPDTPLTKQQKKRKNLLQAKSRAIDRVRYAREKGSFNQEVRALLDYNMLVEYGEKNVFIFNLLRSRINWLGF